MNKTQKQIILSHSFESKVKGAEKAIREALNTGCRKATAYISDSQVATCCARHKPDARSKRVEFVIKLGAPNFVERRFIRICKQAGCAFPLNQVQLKWWPKKK